MFLKVHEIWSSEHPNRQIFVLFKGKTVEVYIQKNSLDAIEINGRSFDLDYVGEIADPTGKSAGLLTADLPKDFHFNENAPDFRLSLIWTQL